MCVYLCILIYAHKSQHFVEAHFRHKHETGNWAHTQRTFCDTATLKFHLKMLISTKRRPLYPPLPQIPYARCLQKAPSRSRTAAGRSTTFFVAYFSVAAEITLRASRV